MALWFILIYEKEERIRCWLYIVKLSIRLDLVKKKLLKRQLHDVYRKLIVCYCLCILPATTNPPSTEYGK